VRVKMGRLELLWSRREHGPFYSCVFFLCVRKHDIEKEKNGLGLRLRMFISKKKRKKRASRFITGRRIGGGRILRCIRSNWGIVRNRNR
jgi:hypothetical protein